MLKLVKKYIYESLLPYIPRSLMKRTNLNIRMCIDCYTAEDSLFMLDLAARNNKSTDDIMSILVRIYRRFPPREGSLRHLSMLQQSLEGSGGPNEFAVCTIFAAMTMALCDNTP